MEKKLVLIINGPNLNYLGIRETELYGTETWDTIAGDIRRMADTLLIEVKIFQSNLEGEIVDFIQGNMMQASAVIINPAGYTKTGYAILDALLIKPIPFIEVHLSNIYAREKWHRKSIFSAYSIGCIIGLRSFGYELALQAIERHINKHL